MVGLIFVAPFWLTAFLILLGIFFFVAYWEAVAFALISQLLFQGAPFASYTFFAMLPFIAMCGVFVVEGIRAIIPEDFFRTKSF